MNLEKQHRLAIYMVALLAICVATSIGTLTAQQRQSGASSGTNRMLDSIPQPLFQKMFKNHQLVGSPGLAWKKQRVIAVAFNGGSADLYELIEKTSSEWTALGGQLSFSFKDELGNYRHWAPNDKYPSADIRIAFNNSGYWSLLGVLAKNFDPGDPTMNFGGFPVSLQKYLHGNNAAEWATSYEHTTILHEFGHAIGLSHEHFNPQCQNDLKINEIIRYLEGPPNKWSEDQAKFNIDAKYYSTELGKQSGPLESRLITSPTTDQSSVMLYVFSSSYYKSGDASACKPIGDHGQDWPTKLSEGDKQFYLANYGVIASPFGASNPAKVNKQ